MSRDIKPSFFILAECKISDPCNMESSMLLYPINSLPLSYEYSPRLKTASTESNHRWEA